jgi:nucleoside-diphosphate-sugar epimerase
MENEKTYGQAFNVAGEERISYGTMADMIEEVCGRTLQRRKMSTADIIRERIPMPFPPDEHLLYDGSKLRTVLGYQHTPFLLGIAKTWRNYQAVVQRRIEMQGGA